MGRCPDDTVVGVNGEEHRGSLQFVLVRQSLCLCKLKIPLQESVLSFPPGLFLLSALRPCWIQMETLTWRTRWTWPVTWRSCSGDPWTPKASGTVSSPEQEYKPASNLYFCMDIIFTCFCCCFLILRLPQP